MSAFEELALTPELIAAVVEKGWLLPSPVQQEAIPLILGGGDVCAAAETGSGKTGAFGLPLLQLIHESLSNSPAAMVGVYSQTQLDSNVGFADHDRDAMVQLSENNAVAEGSNATGWTGSRCGLGVKKGQYAFEFHVLSGLCRLGLSATGSKSFRLGEDRSSFGFGGTGKKAFDKSFSDYGDAFQPGDVIGVLIDRDFETINFAKNGVNLGKAFDIPANLKTTGLKPAACGRGLWKVKLNPAPVYDYKGYKPMSSIDGAHADGIETTSPKEKGNGQVRTPLALVLEPTRDLAEQTYKFFVEFGSALPMIKTALVTGGMPPREEQKNREMLLGSCDVVVGTLQKTHMYAKQGIVKLRNCRYFVLDEADELIKTDEKDFLGSLRSQCSVSARLQTLFFSATLHTPLVQDSIVRLCRNANWVDLKGRTVIPDTVHVLTYKYDPTGAVTCPLVNDKIRPPTDEVHLRDGSARGACMSQKIKLTKPMIAVAIAEKLKMQSLMVFCRTNKDCDNFEDYLLSLGGGRRFTGEVVKGKENRFSCVVLAGKRSTEQRRAGLAAFKSGQVRFLVCTDVAARGIDIAELPFMMMLTLPDDVDQFFHRVGRVGRADRVGLAIAITATEKEKVWYHKCRNRGEGCDDTRLTSEGGCCIWYDEPTLLEAIERRAEQKLTVMNAHSFEVPDLIEFDTDVVATTEESASPLGRRQPLTPANDTKGLGMFGKARADDVSMVTRQRLHAITDSIQLMNLTEVSLQTSFVRAFSHRKRPATHAAPAGRKRIMN